MKVKNLPTLIENLGYALPALDASRGECRDWYLSMFSSFMSKGFYNSLLVQRRWRNERLPPPLFFETGSLYSDHLASSWYFSISSIPRAGITPWLSIMGLSEDVTNIPNILILS